MPLRVVIEPAGTTLYRLYIWDGDQEIGEYERTRAADLERKKAEIASAAGYLLDLFARRGRFIVRWDGVAREKVVRDEFGNRIGAIPREHWRNPSRQSR